MKTIEQQLERAKILLKATHDILKKSDEGPYVEEVLTLTVGYDGTECDGFCLMEDIEHWFDFDVGKPITE